MNGFEARIGIVAPGYAPAIGGVEREAEMIARGLASRGVRVEVITIDPSGELPRTEMLDAVRVRRFPTVRRNDSYLISASLGAWLLKNAHRFDLLHAFNYHAPAMLAAAIAGWKARLPLVLTLNYHGPGHAVLPARLYPLYRPVGRWVVRRARQVVCVSEGERRLVQADFGHDLPLTVIPLGVDVDEVMSVPARSRPLGRTLVLAVGRLDQYKRVGRVVEMAACLPDDYELVVVGVGPERERIEALASEPWARGRVRLLGCLERQELLSWYRTADVFVTMSVKESFGLTLLEAASGGAMIIASDIPVHREIAGFLPQGSISYVPTDCPPALLAAAVQAVLPAQRASGVSDWPLPTWDNVVERLLATYRAVLATPAGKVQNGDSGSRAR